MIEVMGLSKPIGGTPAEPTEEAPSDMLATLEHQWSYLRGKADAYREIIEVIKDGGYSEGDRSESEPTALSDD